MHHSRLTQPSPSTRRNNHHLSAHTLPHKRPHHLPLWSHRSLWRTHYWLWLGLSISQKRKEDSLDWRHDFCRRLWKILWRRTPWDGYGDGISAEVSWCAYVLWTWVLDLKHGVLSQSGPWKSTRAVEASRYARTEKGQQVVRAFDHWRREEL